MAKIYKETVEYEPIIEIGDKEQEFLLDFVIDYHGINYSLDEELLDETLLGWKEQGKEPPEALVKFLREQVKDGNTFAFVIE